MAKKYEVKVIKILLKNGKTAKSGDIISGDKLVSETDAVKGGYVVESKSKDLKDSKAKDGESDSSKDKSVNSKDKK